MKLPLKTLVSLASLTLAFSACTDKASPPVAQAAVATQIQSVLATPRTSTPALPPAPPPPVLPKEAPEVILKRAWIAATQGESESAVLESVKTLSDSGNADAQYWLAKLAYFGSGGVNKDPELAFNLAQKSASKGNAEAIAMLSRLYYSGSGVAQDRVKSIELAKEAVIAESPTGKDILGVRYLQGDGIEKDPAAAFLLLDDAAKAGNVDAAYNLGVLYWQGTGTLQSKKDALIWWTVAAEEGHSNAIRNLERASADGGSNDLVEEDIAKVREIRASYSKILFRFDSFYVAKQLALADAIRIQQQEERVARDPNEQLIARIESKGGNCSIIAEHLHAHLARAQQTGDWKAFRETLGRGSEYGC